MKRKKSQEKRKASTEAPQGERASPQVLLEELSQSPKEKANNVAHLISYIKETVRCASIAGMQFDLAACNVHGDL